MKKLAKLKYLDFVYCAEAENADETDMFPKFRVEIEEHQREYALRVFRHLTSTMHSDEDKRCLCPGGIGACGFGDPDTNICNYPRR